MTDFEEIRFAVRMKDDELSCDNVTVPKKIRDDGATQEMIGQLIRQIGQDFIDNEVIHMDEQ